METRKTLVLGASEKEERYANKAVRRLQLHNIPVIAVGNKVGKINSTSILTAFPEEEKVDTVSLYLSAKNQVPYYAKIIRLKPRRVIFNPGTENQEFADQLSSHNIASEIACTLVLLSTNSY